MDYELIMKRLNRIFSSLQDRIQDVSESDMIEAKKTVDTLTPTNFFEMYTFCASLNLLNTYVKQHKKSLSYYFKRYIPEKIISFFEEKSIEGISIYYEMDKALSVFYIAFYDVIFSFHSVNMPSGSFYRICKNPCYKKIYFDNIRKQRCATSVYKSINDLR